MDFKQDGRSLVVQTPLGMDKLLLTGFQGREEISHLFQFDLELLATEAWFDPKDIIGKAVNVQLTREGADPRWFSGFVSSFGSGGLNSEGFHRYTIRLVPWLWFLSKRSDCRIFQNMTVPQIVEKVFEAAGFKDFDLSSVQATYPTREYCVQLRETDLHFVSRLLEEVGIFYFFRFEEGKHVLVLADSIVAYQDCGEVEFTTSVPSSTQVDRWEHRFQFISGSWSHTDFNFTTPTTDLGVSSPTVVDLPGLDAYQRYEYPGGYQDKADGECKAQARMMAEEVGHDTVVGSGGCPTFFLAGRFEMLGAVATGEENGKFVLTRIEHRAVDDSYDQMGSGQTSYANSFHCIPAMVPFAPKRKTEKPLVHGLQSAIVVGPAGEEIYTDEYGRVKVQFHWDRAGGYDENSSCWIRVMQSVAGKKWGFQTLPRVGQEVICEFLDGDPDRPIVVGAVFNANTTPAYDLPASKTQSGWKSRSTPKADPGDFNELRFEDKAGEEHIFIHAQKNEHHRVRNNRYDHVGHDEHRSIAGTRFTKIKEDEHRLIERDRFSQVDGNQSTTIEGDSTNMVSGAEHLEVGGDQRVKVVGKQHLTVEGAQYQSVGKDTHRAAGGDVHESAGSNLAAAAGQQMHFKAGLDTVIEAGKSITLKAGAAKIVIGPTNVDIVGVMVNINSGGGGGSGAGCNPMSPSEPASPSCPEEPMLPMARQAAADGDAYSQTGSDPKEGEAKWLAIETAPATPQAAALDSAAETGEPFSET